MRILVTAAVLGSLLVAGCATTAPAAQERAREADTQPAPVPATNRILPGNTYLAVALTSALDARTSRIGDRFTATVTEELIAQDGSIVVEEGALLTGLVTGVLPSGTPGDQAAIRLNFVRIHIDEAIHPFSAAIMETELVPAPETEADTTGAGAPVGAVLGAIVGGELRDLLITAALGPGAGSIISLGTGDAEPLLPAGLDMTIRSLDPIQLRR
ncbi:MAG: hypothetical protein WEF86_12985 [Gemmatimonadota bacterium]